MHDQISAVRHEKEKLEREDRALLESFNQMKERLKPDATSPQINDSFSEVLIAVMKNRLDNGITVSSVVPHKSAGNSGVAETSKLRELVPGTSVSSIRVNVRGSYENYDGLTRYIQAIRKLPVSAVYLKVEDRNFDLGLRIYGS